MRRASVALAVRMRPDLLNPLFAEVEALKGVGPQCRQGARPARHHPRGRPRLPSADRDDRAGPRAGRQRQRCSGASSFSTSRRSRCAPGAGRGAAAHLCQRRRRQHHHTDLFNNPGWAKKQLPLGEKKHRHRQARRLGRRVADRPSRGARAGQGAPTSPLREPVYPLTEGIANRRMRELALAALERAPELAEWIEPSLLARQGWPALAGGAGRSPSTSPARGAAATARL